MDTIASYYDLIASITKNDEVTKQEIALIQKHINSGSILDIACGSGRHLIPLSELGYDVSGLDSNEVHLKLLKGKLKNKVKLYNTEFLKADISDRYNALLLFWNSLNEICHDRKELQEFFTKAIELLNKNGIIIINFDDIRQIDPKKLDFEYEGVYEDKRFKYEFKVIDFDSNKNISVSQELLTIDFKGEQKQIAAELIQKWWSIEEVAEVAKAHNFNIEIDSIAANNEIYMILRKP